MALAVLQDPFLRQQIGDESHAEALVRTVVKSYGGIKLPTFTNWNFAGQLHELATLYPESTTLTAAKVQDVCDSLRLETELWKKEIEHLAKYNNALHIHGVCRTVLRHVQPRQLNRGESLEMRMERMLREAAIEHQKIVSVPCSEELIPKEEETASELTRLLKDYQNAIADDDEDDEAQQPHQILIKSAAKRV